jgi:hypothetical protein
MSKAAEEYILDHGDTIFVRPHPHRCCTGQLTLLDSTTARPEDSANFLSSIPMPSASDSSAVTAGYPHHFVIERRGW